MKSLVVKFGYNNLEKLCKKKGWRIPTYQEAIKADDIEHNVVWISNKSPDETEHDTHACLLDIKKDRIEICNKNHRHHCVVVKEKKQNTFCEIICNLFKQKEKK